MNYRSITSLLFYVLLVHLELIAQPIYNSCDQVLELCPNVMTTVNNIDANTTVCPGCEDDFLFCFTPENTIWLSFTTNAVGGNVSIDFSNLQFQTGSGLDNSLNAAIVQPVVPCSAPTYTQVGTCISDATGPFVLTATGLAPNTTFYVVISGDLVGVNINQPGECTFDVFLSGTGVERPIPTIQFAQNLTTLCPSDQFIADVSITNCPDSTNYQWYVNGELVAITSDTLFQSTSLQTGDVVSVSTTCFSACPVTLTASSPVLTVTEFAISAGPDVTTTAGDPVQLNGSTTGTTYYWTPSFGVSDTVSLTPFAIAEETTTYTLTAELNGCTLQDQVTVFVKDTLLIPTTFSPNGDGVNDRFEIKGIEQYPNCYITIYTRWGQEVFRTTGYTNSKAWDGRTKSGELNEGVYFYILELRDDSNQQRQGSITVIK